MGIHGTPGVADACLPVHGKAERNDTSRERIVRSVSFGGALLLALCSTSTWALGLGELEVRSRLNQPLEASIGILDAGAA